MYEEELVNLLIEKKLKISTAESCTGGLVAAELIRTAGASAVYSEGFITYADEAKISGSKKEYSERIWGSQPSDRIRDGAGMCRTDRSRCNGCNIRSGGANRRYRGNSGGTCMVCMFL